MSTTTPAIADAPVLAVVTDRSELPRWLHDRARHHRGRVLVIDTAPLEKVTTRDVAEAIIDGFGKSRLIAAIKRDVEIIAHAWLSVASETDAIIADAAVLPPAVLSDTISLLTGHGIRPWIVVHTSEHHDIVRLADLTDAIVEDWDPELLDETALRAAWLDDPDLRAGLDRSETSWPLVPRVDGLFFRSTVRDTMDPDDAAFVDAFFVNTVHEIRAEIDTFDRRAHTRQFERNLRNRMHEISDDEQLLTAVRAAQVAGVTAGFHVDVDPIRFYGGCSAIPRRGHAVRDDWWTRLDVYRDPDVPATAALHIAGMDLADIGTLTTDDVTVVGTAVTVTGASGATFTLDGPAARFVRAAVAWRVLATGGGSLFATHRAEHLSKRRTGYLATAALDVGVKHTAAKPWRKHPDTHRWLLNYGIRISKLNKAPNG